jgi:hypothetical protein
VRRRLPEVLDFTRVHRAVDLQLNLRVDLSGTLVQALEAGELDLVLAKRGPARSEAGAARAPDLDRGRCGAGRSRTAARADPLSAAQRQPRNRARSARTRRQKLAHRLHVREPQRPQTPGHWPDSASASSPTARSGRAFGTAGIVGIAGARPHRIHRRRERARLARPGERAGGGHSQQCGSGCEASGNE